MELIDLSESQKELLQPLLRLKTDVSLDSLVVLRDVFQDLSNAYSNFASSIKDIENKLLTCYNIASSGSLTPQACEALLMVRGNTPNLSSLILSATAEQSGVLDVMMSMLSFLNRLFVEANEFSNSLDKSVVTSLSSFSNEYLKTFGKDEKRAFRQDISGFIPKLKEFKKSPSYSHSSIKKYVDVVLKSHKELQDCLAYENELSHHLGKDKELDTKLISKAKNRTVRAKVSLGNNIQNLFTAAPELKEIVDFKNADVDTLSQISKVSKKHSDSTKNLSSCDSFFYGTPTEYQAHFCNLEMKRLELFSNSLQHWMDSHAKYKKGVYSQLEVLWKEVVKFSPISDFKKFESYLTGKTVETEPQHSRIWIKPEPGPLEDYTHTVVEKESSTPMEMSDDEDNLEKYNIYDKGSDHQSLESNMPTELSKANESDVCAKNISTIDNITIVQLMQQKPPSSSNTSGDQNVPSRIDRIPQKLGSNLITSMHRDVNIHTLSSESDIHESDLSISPVVEPEQRFESEDVDSQDSPEESSDDKQLEYYDSELYEKVGQLTSLQDDKYYIESFNKPDHVQESNSQGNDGMQGFVNNKQPMFGEPDELLNSTRKRLDDHIMHLFNRCREKNETSRFDWLSGEVEDIVKVLEDYDTYPFTHDYENLENFKITTQTNLPMLRYSLMDPHMDERQWSLFSLEVLMITHQYISSFVNHPCMNEEGGDLREFLLANLGVLEQTLIKFRKTIEAFRSLGNVSDFEFAILDVVLRPRDSFSHHSPSVSIHVMDKRYRILLLIDSFSKGEIVIHSEKLFVISEFYQWMYRQLYVVYLGILQKLSRVINLIPNHSNDLTQRWFRCLKSTNPESELLHGFKFNKPEVENLCNSILSELLKSLGMVNELKEFAVKRMTKSCYDVESSDFAKSRLLELLKSMVRAEELDEELKNYFIKSYNQKRFEKLRSDDFSINMEFFNDDDISVLAEVRNNRAFCFRRCMPTNYKAKQGRLIARKMAQKDLITNNEYNKYFNHRVDKVPLSKCWCMEEVVVLTVALYLHKYLTFDELSTQELPQHFQTIVYLTSFMQSGILPNFNLLKSSVKNNENANFNQIPLIAHSILSSISVWYWKISNPRNSKSENFEKKSVELLREDSDEFYKRLRISSTDVKERLKSMISCKFKVDENVGKHLYILLQMPSNVHYLPHGLTDVDSYLLFDLQKYKNGGEFTPENILPNYNYHDKSCIELITLSKMNDLSSSVLTQMNRMGLKKAYNKVHFFISELLNYQIPILFSLDPGDYVYEYSVLTPSFIERTIGSILYLRFISASFKNDLFKCLCEYSKFVDVEALFFALSLFTILFRILYPGLSENIPNLSVFESDHEGDLYNMINIFRFVVNKNAISFTTECIDRVKETSDSSLDESALIPHIVEEVLQMLRYKCTESSNIWNGFVQYGEFPSLLSNCSILQMKRYYEDKKINAGILMPQLRRLMVLQREFDSSFIVRSPLSDANAQEQRLLNCMFFNYKNSSHKYSGFIEFMKLIKDNLSKALEHKLVGISEIVDASIKRETWKPLNNENSYSSGAVDLITVLKYSLKASFDLSPPVEWLILPFTNACENSLRCYYKSLSEIYHLNLLYTIHSFIISGEPKYKFESNANLTESNNIMGNEGNDDDGEGEKKSKKTLWKRLKNTIGAKAPKSSSHSNLLFQLDKYSKFFQSKSVTEDLARVSNLEYISNQLSKIPEDIFGFYYNQIRQRDAEYPFIHKAIGTSLISDVDKFFFFHPHQLLEIPHSKSLSSLIFASQRILKRDAKQFIMDLVTLVMWKIVFVDFKHQIFYNLYTPDIVNGIKIEDITSKFPQSIFLFINKMPDDYIQFAYHNFFEAFIKSIFYIIRNMKSKDFKFNKTNVKILYHDVDSLVRLLEKYSHDNKPLLNCVKEYILNLI